MAHPLNPLFRSPVARLRVTPDDPATIVGPRPRGSRRPHTDASVAAVRRLIEQSVLTYSQIAAKTGIGRASICRWTRDQGWKRPLFAPRATDTVPSERATILFQRACSGCTEVKSRRCLALPNYSSSPRKKAWMED